jgi:hypothetical protein
VRRLVVAVAVLLTAGALSASAAYADSCANVSRAPAACGTSCSGPVVDGNWVWLPSIGVPVAAWGFAPPGREDSVDLGLPGANGNYTNGQTSSLLGVSAVCQGKGNAQNARQTDHGIQSGCA